MPYTGQRVTHASIAGVSSERFRCDTCGADHSVVYDAIACCTHPCPDCGLNYASSESAAECCRTYTCPNCLGTWDNASDALNCCIEDDEEEDGPVGNVSTYTSLDWSQAFDMSILPLPDRPTVKCSIEQEISFGGREAARLLRELGYADNEHMLNYTYEPGSGGVCVKEDGSLPDSGGEIVYSQLFLDRPTHVSMLTRSLHALRAMRNGGMIGTNTSAGTHFHLAVTTEGNPRIFGPAQIAALYEIFSHCEDVIFRMAAAGWSEHRGDGYTRRMDRMEATPGKVIKHVSESRYFSLNFTRLLDAARGCRCGAVHMGDWQECTCGCLAGGTVEWRVFNATTKPSTMHAWLLLAHAITAKAFDHEIGTLVPQPYYSSSADHHESTVEWIIDNCPLTVSERLEIASLAARSPGLSLGQDFVERYYDQDDDDEEE